MQQSQYQNVIVTQTQQNRRLLVNITRLGLDARDLVSASCIVAGYAVALLLMPIDRNFAYTDDWSYIRTVEKMISGQGFSPSEQGQMTLVTHAYWGMLFGKLFGVSFTTMTAATMALSVVAALTFYVLLRRLGFEPWLSGIGVALLVCNPFYVTLSYTFMTDITFLAMLLLCCLFYLEGLRTDGTGRTNRANANSEIWLWVGSVFAVLAFLTRQFGLAVPVAALLWLLFARRLNRRNLAAIALLPVLATAIYYGWSGSYGPTLSGSVGRDELLDLLHNPNAWLHRLRIFHFALPLLGLAMPLFIKIRSWKWVVPLAAVEAAAIYIQQKRGVAFIASLEQPAQPFTTAQPFRVEFTPIWWLGSVLTVWLLASLLERAWPNFRSLLRREKAPDLFHFLYLTAIVLLVGTFVTRLEFFVKYMLPILPFVIIAGLWQLSQLPQLTQLAHVTRVTNLKGHFIRIRKLAPIVAIVTVLAVVAMHSVASHLDDYDFLAARWQEGRALVAKGVSYDKINNGFIWDAYYLYDEALSRLDVHDVSALGSVTLPEKIIDPEYVISINLQSGYHVIETSTYFSRLDGMTSHSLYVLQRD